MVKSFLPKFLTSEKFNDFTYSKKNHFDLFNRCGYSKELFKSEIDPLNCHLQAYQDLLLFSFIKQNLDEGSKILEVGHSNSQVLKYFENDFECWKIDKLQKENADLDSIDASGYRLVNDSIGNFSDELPDNYFDFVFSISTLQHFPQNDFEVYKNILKDINRVLKPGGYSLHCVDAVLAKDSVWVHPIINYFFDNEKLINSSAQLKKMLSDPELFVMSEEYYSKTWQLITGKAYEEFGMPLSYNILWKKLPKHKIF